MGIREGSKLLHHFGPLTRAKDWYGVPWVSAAAGRQRQRRAGVRGAGIPRRREQGRHGAPDTLVERLSEVCRHDDDDGKDASRGEAADADEKPSDGRRRYTFQWWWQGQRLSTNTHHWAEGVATPFSIGGSSCVNEYVTFGRKAQLPFQRRQRLSANT